MQMGEEWPGGPWWPVSDGILSVGLNGEEPGALAQAFATTAGSVYAVSVDYSLDPSCSSTTPRPFQVIVTSGGSTTTSPTYYGTFWGSIYANPPFNTSVVTFTAAAASSTVTFQSLGGTSCGAVVDNIKAFAYVAPSPPPPPSKSPPPPPTS
eukprot:SM002916S11249  [mRNA]  locus=s2916:706:1578:+ [translate_table: standard]